MKTKLLLLVGTAFLLSNCVDTIPLVNDRAPNGQFITPTCPKDGKAFTRRATLFEHEDENGKPHWGVSVFNDNSGDAPQISQ